MKSNKNTEYLKQENARIEKLIIQIDNENQELIKKVNDLRRDLNNSNNVSKNQEFQIEKLKKEIE